MLLTDEEIEQAIGGEPPHDMTYEMCHGIAKAQLKKVKEGAERFDNRNASTEYTPHITIPPGKVGYLIIVEEEG